MTLKSLPEIAFDGFQTFAPPDKQYVAPLTGKKAKWDDLLAEEKVVFERIAGRVQAEIVLRQDEEKEHE